MPDKFATAINCMDGRAQKSVFEYIQKSFGVEHVDMITEPGPNKVLSEATDIDVIESIKKRVRVSIEKHGSQIIVIAAHHDCAGNPADEETQKDDLRKAVKVIVSWGFPLKKIIALWLDEKFEPSIIS